MLCTTVARYRIIVMMERSALRSTAVNQSINQSNCLSQRELGPGGPFAMTLHGTAQSSSSVDWLELQQS